MNELAALLDHHGIWFSIKYDAREGSLIAHVYFFGDHIPFYTVLGDTMEALEVQIVKAITHYAQKLQ